MLISWLLQLQTVLCNDLERVIWRNSSHRLRIRWQNGTWILFSATVRVYLIRFRVKTMNISINVIFAWVNPWSELEKSELSRCQWETETATLEFAPQITFNLELHRAKLDDDKHEFTLADENISDKVNLPVAMEDLRWAFKSILVS